MEDYIVLYGDKKPEDLICFLNMFPTAKKIEIGWTNKEIKENEEFVLKELEKGKKQIIFLGLEIGWDQLISKIKEKHPNVLIKVICTTLDSLLYYDYERDNFFKLLELNKAGKIDYIAFLRKGQYELYHSLGYQSVFLMENYVIDNEIKQKICPKDTETKKISVGIYPLNYTWDKNIFNQLCIAGFLDNSIIRYNQLDERMKDFLTTMKLKNYAVNLKEMDFAGVLQEIAKNDCIVECAFTEYFHPLFFLSMELGIPCIIGNNTELFEKESKLGQYLITTAEDNPIENANKVINVCNHKKEIQQLYGKWKEDYNKEAMANKKEFLNMGRK